MARPSSPPAAASRLAPRAIDTTERHQVVSGCVGFVDSRPRGQSALGCLPLARAGARGLRRLHAQLRRHRRQAHRRDRPAGDRRGAAVARPLGAAQPSFEPGATADELVEQGVLHRGATRSSGSGSRPARCSTAMCAPASPTTRMWRPRRCSTSSSALGYDRSYQTFTRMLASAGCARRACRVAGRRRGATIDMDHPAGDECQWDWLELPEAPWLAAGGRMQVRHRLGAGDVRVVPGFDESSPSSNDGSRRFGGRTRPSLASAIAPASVRSRAVARPSLSPPIPRCLPRLRLWSATSYQLVGLRPRPAAPPLTRV